MLGRCDQLGERPETHQEHERQLLEGDRRGDRTNAFLVVRGPDHHHPREVSERQEDHRLARKFDQQGFAEADVLTDRAERDPPCSSMARVDTDDDRDHQHSRKPLDVAEDIAQSRRIDADDEGDEPGTSEQLSPESAKQVQGDSQDGHARPMLPAPARSASPTAMTSIPVADAIDPRDPTLRRVSVFGSSLAGPGRPLRVAWFGHFQSPHGNGLAAYSRETVAALRARGVEVLFFAHREGHAQPAPPRDVELRAVRLKTVTVSLPGSLERISAALKAFQPDLVHLSVSFSLLDGAVASLAHHRNVPAVATVHLPYGTLASARARVLHEVYRFQSRRLTGFDSLIALSDAAASAARRVRDWTPIESS